MEDYFTSKLKIFDRSRIACVKSGNMDKTYLPRVLAAAQASCEKTVTFGFDSAAEVQGLAVEEGPGYIVVKAVLDGQREVASIRRRLQRQQRTGGDRDLQTVGVPIETIREGLAHVKVAGRMET